MLRRRFGPYGFNAVATHCHRERTRRTPPEPRGDDGRPDRRPRPRPPGCAGGRGDVECAGRAPPDGGHATGGGRRTPTPVPTGAAERPAAPAAPPTTHERTSLSPVPAAPGAANLPRPRAGDLHRLLRHEAVDGDTLPPPTAAISRRRRATPPRWCSAGRSATPAFSCPSWPASSRGSTSCSSSCSRCCTASTAPAGCPSTTAPSARAPRPWRRPTRPRARASSTSTRRRRRRPSAFSQELKPLLDDPPAAGGPKAGERDVASVLRCVERAAAGAGEALEGGGRAYLELAGRLAKPAAGVPKPDRRDEAGDEPRIIVP